LIPQFRRRRSVIVQQSINCKNNTTNHR